MERFKHCRLRSLTKRRAVQSEKSASWEEANEILDLQFIVQKGVTKFHDGDSLGYFFPANMDKALGTVPSGACV